MLLIFGPFMCTRLMDGRCSLITGFVFTAVIAREVELFFPPCGQWSLDTLRVGIRVPVSCPFFHGVKNGFLTEL